MGERIKPEPDLYPDQKTRNILGDEAAGYEAACKVAVDATLANKGLPTLVRKMIDEAHEKAQADLVKGETHMPYACVYQVIRHYFYDPKNEDAQLPDFITTPDW